MDNFDRHKHQQQVQQILQETSINTEYIDEEIGPIMNDTSGTYQQMFACEREGSRRSNHSRESQNSMKKSESDSEKPIDMRRDSVGQKDNTSQANSGDGNHIEEVNHRLSKQSSQINFEQNQNINGYQITNFPETYKNLQLYYKRHKIQHTLSQVKEKYPYFAISQPTYTLMKVYEEDTFLYNTLKNVGISAMDVGYCAIADNYLIVIGTNDGRVAIFEKNYQKPVNIFQTFTKKKSSMQKQGEKNKIKITSVKWSQNLQYLAVSSNSKQLKVYQFKKSILIQNRNIFHKCRQPIQLFSLSSKQLKNSINYINFVSQNPFLALLIDDEDDMQVLEYKKHFINDRPFLDQLPLKFNNVFQVEVVDFIVGQHHKSRKRKFNKECKFKNDNTDYMIKGTNSINNKKILQQQQQQYGILIAVGSQQYVTLALLKPYFLVIMVYDKDKHGKNIKKQGYSHISFRRQPLGLLIVWDKFSQILDIEIQNLNPLQTNIINQGTHLMPETTLAAGLLTDTLIYQLSESGIKIYASRNFSDEKNFAQFKQYIYSRELNFCQFPQGNKIQEELSNSVPTLEILRLFHCFIRHCNGCLFITSNTSLFSVRIQKYQDFIKNTIQSNWKVGLQLLHDGYLGKYKNYDNMTQEVIVKNIQDYSIRYINFLQMVIDSNRMMDNSETSNRKELWLQEITFLFNILIETEQYEHLSNKVLDKLAQRKLGEFIACIEPFIMLHRLPKITPHGLQLLYQYLQNKQVIRILLNANLKPALNQIDLPHMINQIMLEHRMYEEILAVNMQFGDYFTPIVVMVSLYYTLNDEIEERAKKDDMEIMMQLALNKQMVNEKNEKNQQQKAEQHKIKQKISRQNLEDRNRLKKLISYFTYKIIKKINNNQDIPSHASHNQRKTITNKQKQFLYIFVPLFQQKIICSLLGSEQQELQLFSYIIPQIFKGQCLQLMNDISNKVLNTDLMTDIYLNIPISLVKNLRLYWICMLGLYNKSVIKMDVFMGLRFLIGYGRDQYKYFYGNPSEHKKHVTQRVSLNQHQKKQLSRIELNLALQQIQRCIQETIMMSSKKIFDEFKFLSHELLEQFYKQLLSAEQVLQSSNIGLLKIVAMILGSGYYINVVHAMMSQINVIEHETNTMRIKSIIGMEVNSVENLNKQSNTIFDFIEDTISLFKKNQKEQLKNIICENMGYYIQLDCDRLCNLIINYYLFEIDKFVNFNNVITDKNCNKNNFLGNDRNNQFVSLSMEINNYQFIKLVQKLLQRLQSSEIQNRKINKFQFHSQFMINLRLKLIGLLAVTGRQHEILSEIKKQNYPLDSTLQICQKYGIIDAEAYLLVKSGGQGQIASAIKLYFELITKKIQLITWKTLGEFKDYFISINSQCMRVCEGLHATPDQFNQEWFAICKQLKELKIKMYRTLPACTYDQLYKIIDLEIYPSLSDKIVANEFVDGIIQYLRNNISKLQIVFIQDLFHEILKKNSFERAMLNLTKQTFIESQNSQRKQIVLENYKGFPSNGQCSICEDNQGLVIHYNNCGHEIHPYCGQDVKVCAICVLTNEKVIEKQIDGLKKIKNEVYAGKIDEVSQNENQKDKIQKETKLEKLKKYDEYINIDI